MRELVDEIARALVDHPDGVKVAAVQGVEITVFELRVHPDDLGKVIGRPPGADRKGHAHATGSGGDESAQEI